MRKDHSPILPSLAHCPPLTEGSHAEAVKAMFQHFTPSKISPPSPFLSHAETAGFSSSMHGSSHRSKKTLTFKPSAWSGTSTSLSSSHSLQTERVGPAPPSLHTLHTEWPHTEKLLQPPPAIPPSLRAADSFAAAHARVGVDSKRRALGSTATARFAGGCTTMGSSPGFLLAKATGTLSHPNGHKPHTKNPQNPQLSRSNNQRLMSEDRHPCTEASTSSAELCRAVLASGSGC